VTQSRGPHRGGRFWAEIALAVAVVGLVFTVPGRDLFGKFLASLRMAAPDRVSVTIPSFGGERGGHDVMGLVGGMLAATPTDTSIEPDQRMADVPAAARVAGFTPALLAARHDTPTVAVTGSRAFTVTVDRARLRTIFDEAAVPSTDIPSGIDGDTVRISVPRGVRVQYGHCPEPVANNLRAQIQGPPPLPSDVADCVILAEQPGATVQLPPHLDLAPLAAIALQLSGMSPDEAAGFQRTFDPHAVLAMIMPRFTRSYDSVTVNGARGLLLNTGGRRAPDYVLFWARGDTAFSLSGYGSPTDAVPLASSIH